MSSDKIYIGEYGIKGVLKMGLFKRNKDDSIINEYFKILEDVGGLGKNNAVKVVLYNDYLTLSNAMVKKPISLNYSQITDVFHGYNLHEQDKSAIGRAFAGGLLFGGAGAVVGAMTANGKKQVTKLMFIISYTSSQGEECFLKFEDTRRYKGEKLSQKLKELCNIKEKEPETTTAL